MGVLTVLLLASISGCFEYVDLLEPMMRGFVSPLHGASSGCGRRNSLQYGGQQAVYLIRSRGQPTTGGPPPQKKMHVTKFREFPRAWTDPLE